MLIDRYLPPSDTIVLYGTVVDASPDQLLEEVHRFDFFRVPAVRIPNLMRLWPEQLWRWWKGKQSLPPSPPSVTLDDLLAMKSFEVLVEEPGHELVLGSIGRYWTRDFGAVPFTPETFTASDTPDCGKIAWGIRAEPHGERRSLLIIDVRTAGTDDAARRHIALYWGLVGPVVRFMTRSVLARVRKTLARAPVVGARRGAPLLLEQQLPSFLVTDVFTREVRADAATTYETTRSVDQVMAEDPLMGLGKLRLVPQWIARKLGLRVGSGQREEGTSQPPFVVLAERPGEEYVTGIIGKLWEARIRFQSFAPGDFATFSVPGFAKVAVDFSVHPLGPGRCMLVSEVRTAVTDEEARRRFLGYWRWLKPFAGLVMRRQLALIAREAERRYAAPERPRLVPTLEPRLGV